MTQYVQGRYNGPYHQISDMYSEDDSVLKLIGKWRLEFGIGGLNFDGNDSRPGVDNNCLSLQYM